MVVEAIAQGIGEALALAIGILFVLSLLLGLSLVATPVLAFGYGLRVSTDATVVGAIAGVAGLVLGASLLGTDEPLYLGVTLVAAAIGYWAGTERLGAVRRPPFQGRPYALALVALAVVAAVPGVVFWLYLLGLGADVVGAMRSHPGEGLLLLAITFAPVGAGTFVLRRVLRPGQPAA